MKRFRARWMEVCMRCALCVLAVVQAMGGVAWLPGRVGEQAPALRVVAETVTTPCGHTLSVSRTESGDEGDAVAGERDSAAMPCCDEGEDCGVACYRAGLASLTIDLPLPPRVAPVAAPAAVRVARLLPGPRVPPTPPPILA